MGARRPGQGRGSSDSRSLRCSLCTRCGRRCQVCVRSGWPSSVPRDACDSSQSRNRRTSTRDDHVW